MTAPRAAERVLILAPIGRDAELMSTYLERGGIACRICDDMPMLCDEVRNGAGALVLTDEALAQPKSTTALAERLHEQPPWSEIPIIILTGLPSFEAKNRTFGDLGKRTNMTLIDRPVRIASLVSAAQSALRARQRQYEIRDLMQKLEDRVHERDRFLAILGHELRNPLGAILLASQMTGDDGRLDPEHAELIERQARHLTRLVNDLLDLSRVVSGKIVLKRQPVDLRQTLNQTMQMILPHAKVHKVSLDVRSPALPVIADADPLRAEQIVSNILTNAVKYTPEGGHVIVALEREGDRAAIRVADDGVGIAPERIGTIFELFAQAENAIGRAQGGMGIGLALVRNLVELHGGSVTARSDGLGKGSEFVVTLPIADVEAMPEAAPETRQPEHAGVRRIVIVEDNPDVRELLRLKLRRLGHSVDAVSDGNDGVQKIVDAKPDMALIDIGLPGIDGYQVARQVRMRIGDGVVLVAVSGFGQPEDKRKAIEAGFDDHLTKPADVNDIENLLARFPPRNSAFRMTGVTGPS
ncbi:MAG TPA: hybrid sensor histidine kinase/response regulator [Thermoanaerobaculia bacterium]|nr:hybrid sensor histidine kinase/response regulator [Thermoanaerobaculia bacterium]